MQKFRDYTYDEIEVGGEKIRLTLNTRFFVKLKPFDFTYFPGIGWTYFGKTYGGNNDNEEWTECYINEDEYLVDFNDSPYKIKLTACDQRFGSETFYYSDFISLIKSGHILIKENEFQRVVPFKEITRIPNSCAVLVTEGTTVVDIRDYM